MSNEFLAPVGQILLEKGDGALRIFKNGELLGSSPPLETVEKQLLGVTTIFHCGPEKVHLTVLSCTKTVLHCPICGLRRELCGYIKTVGTLACEVKGKLEPLHEPVTAPG
ncbi:MAG: hypothetical protein EXS59_00655 [Candidatus Taylorbacteria bacterium]|nr:hypothetical protein [Candidatus Taylorbacteria bacterium]